MSVTTLTPASRDELAQIVAEATSVGIHRAALKPFGRPTALWHETGEHVVITALPDRSMIEFAPEDQVAIVGGGMRIAELQAELEVHGYGLPLGPGAADLAVADAIALDLPHGLMAQHGSWETWVLGMKVMLADGTVVTAGARTVKSVAGYDLHKLMIGARGTLGIVLEVFLRAYPIRAITATRWRPTRHQGFFPNLPGGGWIQQTLASDFQKAVERAGERVVAVDPASSVFWATLAPHEDLPRYRGDWVLRAHAGDKNIVITDPVLRTFMIRAKHEFDPSGKLNPGEFFD